MKIENECKVSIIIPVYNAEKYIRQCMNSLLCQTFSEFEIICVDDGSTDESFHILQEYAEHDCRVSVLAQKNRYAGVARNNGLRQARGKYVLFLDADDFFCMDMIEKLFYKAEEDKTQILVFDAFQFDNALEKVVDTAWKVLRPNLLWIGVKSAENVAEKICNFTTPAPWNKFFLREFIIENDLWFQAIPRTNDLYFVYAALSYAERIGILNEKLIYYRDNNIMSLQGSGEQTPTVFAEALFALRDNLKKRGVFKVYQNSFDSMARSICIYNLNNMKGLETYNRLYFALKQDIFPKLEMGFEKQAILIARTLKKYNRIMVYGAGALAKAIVRFLMWQYGYEKEQIIVVVSKLGKDEQDINGIKVIEFGTILDKEIECLILIAVAEEKAQEEIERGLIKREFSRYIRVGFEEIVSLIRFF